MNIEILDLIDDPQWYCYRHLELIPKAAPKPSRYRNPLTSGLNTLWSSLLSILMEELVEEQRIEYLDRCWALDEFGEGERPSSSLRRFWTLIE